MTPTGLRLKQSPGIGFNLFLEFKSTCIIPGPIGGLPGVREEVQAQEHVHGAHQDEPPGLDQAQALRVPRLLQILRQQACSRLPQVGGMKSIGE